MKELYYDRRLINPVSPTPLDEFILKTHHPVAEDGGFVLLRPNGPTL